MLNIREPDLRITNELPYTKGYVSRIPLYFHQAKIVTFIANSKNVVTFSEL